MILSKNAVGNLINRYRAVLGKCRLINTFGSLALAAALIVGSAGLAAADWDGTNLTVGTDGEQTSLTVGSAVILSETLTITDGGTVTVTPDGRISAGDGAVPSDGKLLVKGGTLNINGYSDSRDLQITGGTVNVNGTAGTGWRENALGGYAETTDENGVTASTGKPTLVSGATTEVNVTSATLFGGAATDFTTAQLKIADGATVNLNGLSPDESHTRDFDDAGMLFAGNGTDRDHANLLITGAGTTVNITRSDSDGSNHGVFNAGVTSITDNATVNVLGGLLLTGYLGRGSDDTQKVTDAMPLAADGYTSVNGGGSLVVGDKGHLVLNKGMTLDIAADGALTSSGKVSLYGGSALEYSAGGDKTLTGTVANAGAIQVTDARLDLTGAKLEKFGGASGTAGTIAVLRDQNTDNDKMARIDMNAAQLADWLKLGGSVTVKGNSALKARLHLGTEATLDAGSIIGSTAAESGKVALLGNGSIQAQNMTLTGDVLAIGTSNQDNRIKVNSLTLTPNDDQDFTLESGKLYLKGEAGSALSFVGSEGHGMQIATAGQLKLGDTPGSAPESPAVVGGSLNTTIASSGTVEVANGTWVLTKDSTLNITGGSLTIGGSKASSDAAAPMSAELNIQGTLKSVEAGNGDADVDARTGINVMQNGVLSGAASKFVTYTGNDVAFATGKQIYVANGGTLRLDGLETLTLTQAKNTKSILADGSAGLINYGNAKLVIDAGDKTDGNITSDKIEGTQVVVAGEKVAYAATGNSITVGGGFGADALVITGNASDVAVDIGGDTTLLGNSGQLITTADDKKANVTVAAGKSLNLGSTGATSKGGTLNGNVALGDDLDTVASALNVAAANFTVGDITAGTINKGDVNVSANGGLTANNIGAAGAAVNSVIASSGTLIAASINAAQVSAENGGMVKSTDTITAGASGVKVASGGAVTADKAIDTSTVAVDSGAIAAKTLTASAAVTVANGTLTTTGTETDASSVTGDLSLTSSQANLGDMTVTGTTTVTNGSSLAANSLTVNGNSAFTNGAKVNVSTLTGASDKTIAVGSDTDTAGGSTLVVDRLVLNGGSLLIDPAWNQASSNVAVGSFADSATGMDYSINGNVGVGMNSMAAIGTTDTGWLIGQVNDVTKGAGLTETGVTAALGLKEAQVLGAGFGIEVDGSKTSGALAPPPDTATFADGSLLVVTAAAAQNGAGALSAAASTSASIGDSAKLRITDAKVGQKYTVLGDNIAANKGGNGITLGTDKTGWTGSNFSTDSRMIKGSFDAASGELTASLNSSANVYPKLDGELVKVLDNAYTADQVGPAHVNSDVKGVRFLSRATNDNFIGANADLAAKTIESAARIAVAGAVPQMAMAASNAAGAAVTQRTSIAQPDGNGMQSVSLNKGDDVNKKGVALWIMPLYQNQNAWSMEAGNNYDLKWHGGLGGVALGGDYTFDNALRAGIAFNIGGGYAEGEGDLAKTTNSFNFWGLGAYAGWAMENFGVTADVNYTSTYNKVKQELPGAMQMRELKSDITAYALSSGLRAEYKFNTQYVDIIPHLGVRYMYVNTDSYDVKSSGTVMHGDETSQNIWTFPIGVTFSKQVETGNGWYVKPNLDLGVLPATGDIDAKSKIRFTGTGTKAELDTRTMDYMSYTGGLGLDFGNNNLSFGLNYNIQASEHTTSHGVFGTARYEF